MTSIQNKNLVVVETAHAVNAIMAIQAVGAKGVQVIIHKRPVMFSMALDTNSPIN